MILKKIEQARQLAQMLKADNMFSPCPVDSGDEIFPNGVFEFNITKTINHIQTLNVWFLVQPKPL